MLNKLNKEFGFSFYLEIMLYWAFNGKFYFFGMYLINIMNLYFLSLY
jgi:hypothetical protein